MNIKTIAFIAMTLMALTSCNKKAAKDSHPQKEEAKVEIFRPEVLLGDSIKTLVDNKIVFYSTQDNSGYTLTNRTLAGLEFEEIGINPSNRESKVVRNISYASYTYNTEIKKKYAKVLAFFKKYYGEPDKESRTRSRDNVAEYTVAAWDCQKYYACISVVAPKNEIKGVLIVLFTIPEDYEIFKTLFN